MSFIQPLNGSWEFCQAGTEAWLPASVPGCVHTDLVALGRIPDPFVGANENEVQWVAGQDWIYQRVFDAAPGLMVLDHVFLIAKGLDTLAEVTLNGHLLGSTSNMYLEHRWAVKDILRSTGNVLTIRFCSPVAFIRQRQKIRPLPGIMNHGAAHIRKAPSHFGWDWGPALPTSGIWRNIWLEGHTHARIGEVRLRQTHVQGRVDLMIHVTLDRLDEVAHDLNCMLIDPEGMRREIRFPVTGMSIAVCIPLEKPHLWWPNGLGEQPLYRLDLQLLGADTIQDEKSFQIGLRTVELRRRPDQWGESFEFVVNGVPVFAKGANWIPADSFPSRIGDDHLEHLIHSAALANMNMLRVWGGGYYESERFYDLCDRYGLLVWQDLMFACAMYPLDEPAFVENVRQEVVQQVRRLRHRACLALWCGNNEIELLRGMWPFCFRLWKAYREFFYRILPEWIAAEDQAQAYWPSSPAGVGFRRKVNSDTAGDTHIWHVWHGLRSFTYYRQRFSRFVSEFGLESFPDIKTINAFASPADHRLNAPVMRHHQRSPGGNDKMAYYIAGRFWLTNDFDHLVYLAQISQAECVRTGVEHWRRHRPRCAGALYWQFNDCWPGASWSGIDYFGRWKALQYAAKRFFSPVALSVEESGSQAGVFVANDLAEPFSGQLRWSLETFSGEVVLSGEKAVLVKGVGTERVAFFDFRQALRRPGRIKLAFVVELWEGPKCLAQQVCLFAPERKIRLPEPQFSWQLSQEDNRVIVELSATNLARFVELRVADSDMLFSDNFFDLPAGRMKHIAADLPKGWTLGRFKNALSIRSLAGTRPNRPGIRDQWKRVWIGLRPYNLITRLVYWWVE